MDKPNYRKRHQGAIPLVGGISVFAGSCFAFTLTDFYIPHIWLYSGCAGCLVMVGALDDRYDISVKFRAVVQAAVAVVMMMKAKIYLLSLGYIFGPGADCRSIWLCPDAVCRLGCYQCVQYG